MAKPQYPEVFQVAKTFSAKITEQEWTTFESSFVRLQFKKGEFLIRPGQSPDQIYIILSGVVRNYFISKNGREYTKIFRGPLSLVGPYSEIIAKIKTKYYVEATLGTDALAFPFKVYAQFMEKYHAWEHLGRSVAEMNYLEKENRESMLIHMDIAEKYALFRKDFMPFYKLLPQKQIASYLGVSPEALNRYLKKSKISES